MEDPARPLSDFAQSAQRSIIEGQGARLRSAQNTPARVLFAACNALGAFGLVSGAALLLIMFAQTTSQEPDRTHDRTHLLQTIVNHSARLPQEVDTEVKALSLQSSYEKASLVAAPSLSTTLYPLGIHSSSQEGLQGGNRGDLHNKVLRDSEAALRRYLAKTRSSPLNETSVPN